MVKDLFFTLGYEHAQADIHLNQLGEVPDSNSPDYEIKPFTTKVYAYQLASIDALAAHIGISRNTLVSNILESYLGNAFVDYVDGYAHDLKPNEQSSEQLTISKLEAMLKDSGLSEKARSYLSGLVLTSLEVIS